MLLTIAIPSNNKTYLLDEAINSILNDSEFGKEIDLVISDNSLNENTKNLYYKKYVNHKNINWFESKKFKCLDSNVNRAIELSKSKYVWIFGDDDLIENNILSSLKNYLNNENPDILILNSKSFNKLGIVEESRLPLNFWKIYDKNQDDQFLKEIGGYLTYIGSIIVRKDLWIKYYDKKAIGSFFAHINCIANIKIGRRAHYFPLPAINMRIGSQTWTKQSFLIWHKFYPEIIWNLKNYSRDAKQSVISEYPIKSLKVLIASRAYKRFNFNIWKNIILISKEINRITKYISFFIAIIPYKLFSILYIFYIKTYRRKHTFNFSPKLALEKLKVLI